ncbi:MAG: DUF1610 domain-containing protein [Candidatus Aenigmarchaeota archaeon]|nr:DUF1610 domain-containing protein [Candidatus Aenigmarchaeota archaeon]
METLQCTSCRINVLAKKNFVKFSCPKCGEVDIVRCSTCKNLGIKYSCNKCDFEGP